MKRALFLAATMLLGGCATVYDKPWTRPGATEDQLFAEKSQCKFDSAGNGMTTAYLFVQCMQGKGWRTPNP